VRTEALAVAPPDCLGVGRGPLSMYGRPVTPMPQPGDRHPGFIVEPMRCWAMVYDGTMQADHCPERPNWTGRWFSPKGDRWWRVWACREHLEGLTGLREFGGHAR
jgi:hypothetical protein